MSTSACSFSAAPGAVPTSLTERMQKAELPVDVLHGDKGTERIGRHILEAFRIGETPVLIATDLAARGIDIENISHIINFDLPTET